MNELIKITENESGELLVSGRDLHEFLILDENGKGTEFRKWILRMIDYGFEENVDYVVRSKMTVANQHGGTKEIKDYYMKIDMAKEICMIQRNDKGKQARLYFIETEKRYKAQAPQLTQKDKLRLQLFSGNDLLIAQAHKELVKLEVEEATAPLIERIEEDTPKVEYYKEVLQPDHFMTVTKIAGDLGMSAKKLNKILHDKGIQYSHSGTWILYQDYKYLIDNGCCDYNITVHGQQLRWSEKGREFIINLLKEEK